MTCNRLSQPIVRFLLLLAVVTASLASVASDSHTSSQFAGKKANTGTVTQSIMGGKSVLTLSEDFVPPESPDPHWQLVDSAGNVYLVDKLKIKALEGERIKKQIVVPTYVKDVAKVQMWC